MTQFDLRLPLPPVSASLPLAPSMRKRIADQLASVKFAVSVLILLTAASILGTVLPQGAEVEGYLQHHPGNAGWMKVATALGLTHVFDAWWFVILLCLLAATVAACSTRRFAVVRRTRGYAQRRALGSMLAHLSLLLILSGAVIRATCGQKGNLPIREGESVSQFRVENGLRDLPFKLQLAKFEVERYRQASPPVQPAPVAATNDYCAQINGRGLLVVQIPKRSLSANLPVYLGTERPLTLPGETVESPNTVRVKFLKYLPDFQVDPNSLEARSQSSQPNNPALLVAVKGSDWQCQRWIFSKSPDLIVRTADSTEGDLGPLRLLFNVHPTAASPAAPTAAQDPIKSFRSKIRVIQDEEIVQTYAIEVNRPFRYRGFTFYQTGYDPNDPGWTSLQVVRDPGVPLVYAGFLLLVLGLSVVFYLNPWIEQRRKSS